MKNENVEIEKNGEPVTEEVPVAEEPVVEEAPAIEGEPVTEGETEEPETGTLHPAVSYIKENPGICIGLGVVLGILAALLILFFLKKKKNGEKSVTVKNDEIIDVTDHSAEIKKAVSEVNQNPVAVSGLHELGARENQQDSYVISDYFGKKKGIMAIVADGMGGLSNGKDVSSLVVKTCLDTFQVLPDYIEHEDVLVRMAAESNEKVNKKFSGKESSGSTMVAAIIGDAKLHFLSIGDSRIYLYRSGALLQLNREHIYREELTVGAVNGKLSIHEANHDSQANSLTSYLGIGRVPHIDRNIEAVKLIKGDKILLASDGVFGTLSAEQMERALQLPVKEAAEKMKNMVAMVNKKYQDNYTAIVMEYQG